MKQLHDTDRISLEAGRSLVLFYNYPVDRGREILVGILADRDPFTLPPSLLVERLLAAGLKPNVDQPKKGIWDTVGRASQVMHGGQTFIVAVSHETEQISLQEMRVDAYAVKQNSA